MSLRERLAEEVGGLWNALRRKQWAVDDESDETGAVHAIPLRDLVAHERTEDCVCGPRSEPAERGDGGIGWVIIHHALDRRR